MAMYRRLLFSLVICIVAATLSACGAVGPLPPELEVSSEDVTLYARIAGDPRAGNVLIAISGGPGLSSDYMTSLKQLGDPEFAVVTYDSRGTGRSTAPAGGMEGYELSRYASDLDAVREAVGADRAHLLGHSWGGLVAMYYAAQHPQRVSSIVLVSSGPPTIKASNAGQRRLQERIGKLMAEGYISQDLPGDGAEAAQAIMPAYFSDPGFKAPAEIKETEFNPTAFQQTMSALGYYDLGQEVSSLQHRVLILWGEDDPFDLPMGEATRDALSAAQVEFVVLEGCAHFWQECPDQFFPRLRAFLDLPTEP